MDLDRLDTEDGYQLLHIDDVAIGNGYLISSADGRLHWWASHLENVLGALREAPLPAVRFSAPSVADARLILRRTTGRPPGDAATIDRRSTVLRTA